MNRGVCPDQRRDLLDQLIDVLIVHIWSDLDRFCILAQRSVDRLHGVHRLILGVEEKTGAVGEIRSGTVTEEQVWEVGDGDTQIRAGLITPLVVK